MSDLDNLEGKPRCHCGVFGVYGHPEASTLCYYGLHALQHRGQEAAGIVSRKWDKHKKRWVFNTYKGTGLVSDIFNDIKILQGLSGGNAAIGHNRYSTTGASENKSNIQPLVINYKDGNLAICHNGNLTNYKALRAKLQEDGTIFQTTSDTEIILHLAARSKKENQIMRIKEALETIEGAFSILMLTDTSLIAARDPHGFRPLALGKLDNSYVIASETCAFDIIGAEYIRDVEPGEIIVIDDETINQGNIKSYWLSHNVIKPHFCIFEFIYFSRPDSIIFGTNVDQVRRKLGKLLAHENPIVPQSSDDRVIVISVPDSSNTSALGYVRESNKQGIDVRLELGLIRSHYVGRTFIQPGQDFREIKVKTKFNTVKGVLKNRKVIIVDDSIVRGTTSKRLVKLIRETGAKEVHFRVASPPIKFPCFYGMDFPSKEELIASRHNGNIEEIRKELDVDSLSYLSIENLLLAAPTDKNRSYCTACFTGNYPTQIDFNVDKNDFEYSQVIR